MLAKKDILKKRNARHERLKRKRSVQKALINGINTMKEESSYGNVKMDKQGLQMWRTMLNSRLQT